MRLLYELRDDDAFLVVLGGLVPELLVRDDDLIPQHLGTTDVDILLITHIEPDADLGGVERALERMNFEPDPTEDGWRWRGAVEGQPVKLEFLCDLPDHREGEMIRPLGCTNLSAANLRGTGYVARDFVWEELSGTIANGTQVRGTGSVRRTRGLPAVEMRSRPHARGLEGLLRPRLRAPANRAGGPEQAARRLLDGGLADALGALRTTFLEVKARYVRTTDSGPLGYAEQALDVEPEADPALLRADAVDVVQRFLEALGI